MKKEIYWNLVSRFFRFIFTHKKRTFGFQKIKNLLICSTVQELPFPDEAAVDSVLSNHL